MKIHLLNFLDIVNVSILELILLNQNIQTITESTIKQNIKHILTNLEKYTFNNNINLIIIKNSCINNDINYTNIDNYYASFYCIANSNFPLYTRIPTSNKLNNLYIKEFNKIYKNYKLGYFDTNYRYNDVYKVMCDNTQFENVSKFDIYEFCKVAYIYDVVYDSYKYFNIGKGKNNFECLKTQLEMCLS